MPLVGAKIRKRVAIHVFHGDRSGAAIVHEIVNAHDILVSQLKAALGLAFEVAHHGAIANEQIREKF